MTEKDALDIITGLVEKVSGKRKTVLLDSDLRKDNILDSLDILIFFMEFENMTGIAIPETETLISENWFSVYKLCQELLRNQK